MNKFREIWRNPKVKIMLIGGGLLLAVIIAATIWSFAKNGNKAQDTNGSQSNNSQSQNGNQNQNQSSGGSTNNANSNSQSPAGNAGGADNTSNSPTQNTGQPVSLATATGAAQKSTGNQQAEATAVLKTSGAWSVVQINIGQNTAVAIFNGDTMVVPPGTGFSESFLQNQGVPADIAAAVAGD